MDVQPRTKRRATTAVAVALAVVTALAGPVAAHLLSHDDPDDTAEPFDISSAGVDRDGGELTATVRTYDVMRDSDFVTGDALLFEFDSRGGGRPDYTLRLEYYEGSFPYCSLYDAEGFSVVGGSVAKGRRSMSCVIPWGSLHASRHIRWRVTSSTYGERDRAPDRGWYSH